jgi:hypothetical protein
MCFFIAGLYFDTSKCNFTYQKCYHRLLRVKIVILIEHHQGRCEQVRRHLVILSKANIRITRPLRIISIAYFVDKIHFFGVREDNHVDSTYSAYGVYSQAFPRLTELVRNFYYDSICFTCQQDTMFVYLRLLLLTWWFVTRAIAVGALRFELNDGQVVTVDDEKSITPTVDRQPRDPIFGSISSRDIFGRQYCSRPGQNIICANGCCQNDNYCCENASCLDPTTRICCPGGGQCYRGGDCCRDGNCVSGPRWQKGVSLEAAATNWTLLIFCL